jgi:hypothetical protein
MNGNESTRDPKITYEWLRASDMQIDPRVQQQIDPRKVGRITRSFDPSALGVCTVSRRDDGVNVLLNGQHRTAGATQAGYVGKFHCEIHHGLTLQDEAHLFLTLNHQTTPSSLSKFLVRITAGDPLALDIEAIFAGAGWHIRAGSEDASFAAVTAIERVYRNAAGSKPDGAYPEITEKVVAIITKAWGHDYRAVNGQIVMGIAQIIGRFGGAVNTNKLIREMQQITPMSLTGNAKALQSAQGGTIAAAVAKVLVGKHNRKLRTNLLPEWVWTR